MNKARRWRKIITMMLTVVMLLQNTQSVMVFADVTNEQIEQRLAGEQPQVEQEQTQAEQTQPEQSQVETRASGEGYKAQAQESQEGWSDGSDTGNPDAAESTTMEGTASNANVTAAITQSVFQAEVSGTVCNFVQMTAQITNHDAENPATGVSIKALLHSSQLSYVNGYGTETAGAGAYVTDSNNTSDLPGGSANGYDQIIMWTDQTIAAGGMAVYQFAAQIIPATLDGVVNAWYVNGNSCGYTWQNTEILTPAQTPEATPEVTPETTPEAAPEASPEAVPETMPEVTPETTPEVTPETTPEAMPETAPETTPEITPEITETPEENRTPEVTEDSAENPTPEPTQEAEDKKTVAAKKKRQQRLLAQRNMEDRMSVQAAASGATEPDKVPDNYNISDSKNTVKYTYFVNDQSWDGISPIPRDATIDFHLEYTFHNDNKPSYTYYDRFYYELPTLPAGLKLTTSKNGEILLPNGVTVVGSYRIDETDRKVYFTYDRNYVKGKNGFTGTFDLYVELDKNSSAKDYNINIGTISKITFMDSDVQGEKSYTVGADGYLHFTVTLTATDADVDNVTVTDRLTGSLTFDENWNPTAQNIDGAVAFSETPTNDGKTAVFKIAKVKYGKPVTIMYKVKPGADASGTNTASWTWGEDGKNHNKENAESKVEVNNHKISKTSTLDKDSDGNETGKINYTIVVNELAANLIPDDSQDQWIKFVDTLPSNVKYVDGSLKVTGKNNEDLVTIQKAKGLTLNGNTIELQILDETCAIVSYQVRVLGKKGDTVIVNNTAQLTGNVTGSDEDTITVSLEKSSATFSGIAGTAQFIKKDYLLNTASKIVPLEGVKFDLYECSLDWNRQKTKVNKNYVSDSTGTVIFGSESEPLKTSTLYCFKESELQGNLKDRYILDDKTEYYFVLFSDNDSEDQKVKVLNSIKQFYGNINVVSGVNDLVLNNISNYKIPIPVKPEFKALKKLDGETPGTSRFEFVMKFLSYDSQNKGYAPSANLAYSDLTATNDSNGNISFPKVELKYPGKYQFEVYEKDKTGYVKDNSHYTVTYVVNWDRESEKLILKSTTIKKDGSAISSATPVFNNYTSTGLTITKNTETTVDTDTEFKFKLNGADFSGLAVEGSSGIIESRSEQEAIVKVTIPAGGSAASVNLIGLLKGAHITVKEIDIPTGWHLRTYTPESTDKTSASISLDGNSSKNVVEVKNYYKETGEATFKVTKNFNGWTDNPNQKFTFNVTSLGNTLNNIPNPMPQQTSITLEGNSRKTDVTGSFGKLSFEQLGSYYYKITELIPNDVDSNYRKDGITYDPKITYVKVEVVKGSGGKSKVNLFASDPISNAEIQNENIDSINAVIKPVNGLVVTAPFTNSISESGITFKATKQLTGKKLENGEFTFGLKNENEKEIQTANNDAEGNIIFTQISYKSTDLGVHTYNIYEKNDRKHGVKYDNASYEVTVNVSQNADGTLKITCDNGTEDFAGKTYAIPLKDNKTANFINKYEASTSIQFTGVKELLNKELPDSNTQFTFKIEGHNISNGMATVNNTGRKIEFPRITYTQEDLKDTDGNYLTSKAYNYRITEVIPNDAVNGKKDGIAYDTKSYNVNVVLSQTDGQLSTTVKVNDEQSPLNGKGTNPLTYELTGNNPTFVNEYGANDIRIKLIGKKYLENQKLVDGKYTFKIEPYNVGTPASTIQGNHQVLNETTENANITFPDLKITLSDMKGTNGYPVNEKTFKYLISEISGNENGITYSEEQYLVEVKVINTNGKLTADGIVEKVKDKDGNIVTNNITMRFVADDTTTPTVDIANGKNAFTNTYHAEATVQFRGTKALVDALGKNMGVSGREFEFEISGPKLGENNTDGTNRVAVKADGTFEFPVISYNVTDLDHEDENYTSKSFTYTIKEVIPKEEDGSDKNVKDGITYDTTSYKIVVTVTNDIQTGRLIPAVELAEDSLEGQLIMAKNNIYTLAAGKDKATFTNTYDAATEYPFKVVKRLAGREFKEGDNFRFELLKGRKHIQTIELKVGKDGTEIRTDADGQQYLEASFEPQKYDLNDVGKTYEYTIRELNPENAMEGVTIDDDIYIVDVTISDHNNNGKLTATAKRVFSDVEEHKTDFNEAVFINTYKAEGTAQIVAKKFLSPGDIGAEKFTFTLTQVDDKGNVVSGGISQTKQNEGNSIIFDPIKYHQKGEKDGSGNIVQTTDVGKTFWYEVKETAGTDTKYTYDNKVYKVKVEISINPDDNRKLVATQTIYDVTGKEVSEIGAKAEAIVFTNSYKATGSVSLTGKKVIEGAEKLKAGEFNFEVREGVGEDAKVVATGTNDENGNIKFSEIKYVYNSETNDLGEHVYTVTEVQPKDGDEYVYDLTSRKIVVKVTDNKDNTLKAELLAVSEKNPEVKSDVTDKVINSFHNRKISVTIRKTDAKGARLAGAELTLYKYEDQKKGDVVDTWETKEEADHTITGKLIAGKTYILEETKVPDGYAKANPIIFTVKNDDTRTIEVTSGQLDKDGNLVMVDQKTGVQILKVDSNGKGVRDALLAVYDGDRKIEEWTSDGEPHAIEGLVAGRKYTLRELQAPAGYKKAADQEFEVSDSKILEVRMVDKPTKVSIMKVDGNGQGLKGAVLELRDSTGRLIAHWESDGTAHILEGELIEGATYTLSEISAPEGYTLAKPQTFVVSEKDQVTEVKMENIPNSVIISKKSLTGVNSIAGAVLRVVDAQGKEVVAKWTTEAGKDKVVTGIFKPNVTYTLEEISAPAGYRKADNITFSLNEAGEIFVNNEKVTSVIMRDAMTKASILKTDESGKALSGATLVVKDSAGKELDKWTTDGKAHEITGLLTVGETYTLSEISAPSGYTVAPDQTFKMEDKDVIQVTMVDYQASGSGQITVTKKVTLLNGGSTEELIAADDTFYVNLFTDAAGKYPYKGAMPQAIHLVNASAGSVTFSDLAQGTYYVYETDANGNVVNLDQLSLHNGSQFMCIVDGGSNVVQLDLKAGPKEGFVNLENAFYKLPDGYYYKGEININKQVLKGDSQTTTNDTFYAGVFTKDEQGIYNLYQVVELVQNDTVTLEVPLGGEDGTEPINYYILETDADGNILDLDVFEYEVTGEGTVTLSKENQTGNINLVNRIPEETDGKLRVQKTDGNGVGLAGASFRLTDSEGAVIEEWTSQASAHELELEPGTYTLTEIQAPTGYTGAGSLKITVDEDYNFSVSGEIEYSYRDGLLKIVNKVVPVTPQPRTPVSGGTGAVSYSSALSGKVAVKTGDTTPVGWFLGLFATAAIMAGAAVHLKRRKR